MSVAAAIRIASPDQARVIEHATAFARRQGVACYVISVVPQLPYGDVTGDELEIVLGNLKFIAELNASPVMQEGDDVAMTLIAVASGLAIRTLFLQSSTSCRLGRSIAEQLLYLNPPFDVVVVGSE